MTAESSASATVSPPLSEAARPLSSAEAKKTQYDKRTKQEEELLVQLWAEKHDQLESRESRKTWVWIAEKISMIAFQQDGRQMYSRIHVDWHILLHGASTLYEAKVLSLADFTRNLS